MTRKSVDFGRTRLDPERLARTVRERRESMGLSLRELAEQSGVASSTIHNLEGGSYKLQLDKFLSILAALDLAPTDVLEIDSHRADPPLTDAEKEVSSLLKQGAPASEILRKLAGLLEGG